jgi:hypothetical protein
VALVRRLTTHGLSTRSSHQNHMEAFRTVMYGTSSIVAHDMVGCCLGIHSTFTDGNVTDTSTMGNGMFCRVVSLLSATPQRGLVVRSRPRTFSNEVLSNLDSMCVTKRSSHASDHVHTSRWGVIVSLLITRLCRLSAVGTGEGFRRHHNIIRAWHESQTLSGVHP